MLQGAYTLFSRHSDGIVTYEEFKRGLTDLGIKVRVDIDQTNK